MQRCLNEMGLRVLSLSDDRIYNNRNNAQNGQPIRYIFRCFSCFTFEENTSRVICRNCGMKTYQRVAVYQDNNGKLHYRFYARDRYSQRYLENNHLVPRGAQLIKFNDKEEIIKKKTIDNKKKKKRGYLYSHLYY